MKTKKIIFLSGAVPPQTGGELYNYKISQYLQEKGQENGIEQTYISLHHYRHLLRVGRIPIIGDLIVSLILAIALYPHQGILVEDHYFSRYLFVTNLIQKFFSTDEIITIIHLFYHYDSGDRWLIRRWINCLIERSRLVLTDIIVTSSEYSKREIISLGIHPDRVQVIHPGIDREKFAIHHKSIEDSEQKKILCVANYVPRKGILYLIEAFAQIEQKDFKLHLVGNPKNNGSYYKKMLKRINELGIEEDVQLHDGADQKQIQYLYSTSDIFVLPSLKETFGIVLIEAMHYRLPIITTTSSAMPDLVTDGENGLLVPPKHSQAIAHALSRLMSQPELRKQMGEQGYQRIEHAYKWEDTTSKFLSLIHL
ncbi:MAG: glycosyltransferase family 4 protein [Elainellaceae cyanobacterium]